MKQFMACALITSFLWPDFTIAAECGMIQGSTHDQTETVIYQAPSGLPSIFYTAKMAVNTDGNPRSYHPDDPRGKTLALNNMGNGITAIFDRFGGHSIGCSPRQGACFEKYIATFEAARNSLYSPTSPWVETRHIIPWRMDSELNRKIPCTFQAGKYTGYFISQTAFPLYNGEECDPARYIDAMTFNGNVLPSGAQWKSQGIVTDGFDLVVLYNQDGNRVVFGVNGDRGPPDSVGEVTVAMAANMRGVTLTGEETYETGIKPLALPKAGYLIFPSVDVKRMKGQNFTQQEVNEIGGATLENWGGMERLKACASLPRTD